MKSACLTELTSPVLHVILAKRLIGPKREQRFVWVNRSLHSTTTLNIRRMIVLARSTVFASSSPQIISTIFNWPIPPLLPCGSYGSDPRGRHRDSLHRVRKPRGTAAMYSFENYFQWLWRLAWPLLLFAFVGMSFA